MFPTTSLTKIFLLVAVCFGSATVWSQTVDPKTATSDPNDVDFVRSRFNENGQRIAGMMWSLTHN
ncbi:MAG: hypothetical protein KA956_11435, partial [Pyrinomonadaceae bacterium]|nr:hypothetical protein [Pyrinomonadaceae bacterium]